MKPTRTVKTADTLFTIIDRLHEEGDARVTEIANDLGHAKSTVYDHLATLEERGYVVKEDDTYRLGLRFLDHGTLVQRGLHVRACVEQPLSQLAESTGESTWFVFSEGEYAYYLFWEFGGRAVDAHGRIGRRVPFHAHAGGKAILAQFSDEGIAEIVERRGLDRYTESTITEVESLTQEVDLVRSRGYAVDCEELVAGFAAIAVPVFDDETVRGSVCLSGPANRITGEWTDRDTVAPVRETAEEISLRLTNDC